LVRQLFRGLLDRHFLRALKFAFHILFGFAKLTDRLTHAASQFGKLFRTEKQKANEQDDDEVGPTKIENTG